jgi:hypothetical protein
MALQEIWHACHFVSESWYKSQLLGISGSAEDAVFFVADNGVDLVH